MTATTIAPHRTPLAIPGIGRTLWTTAALMTAAGLVFLLAYAVDGRTLLGEAVWTKPLRFAAALAVYAATLALYARWLPARFTASRTVRIFVLAGAAAIVAEMVWIGTAAGLGVRSHFNESALGTTVYGLMGVLATLLTSLSLVWGIAILRAGGEGLAPPLRLGLGLGLVLTFPLTMLTAGTMSATGPHPAGAPAGEGALPGLGWSTTGGDLAAAHFLATHALHAIPLAALLAVPLGARAGRVAVVAAAVLYTALVLAAFALAFAGRPFPPLP